MRRMRSGEALLQDPNLLYQVGRIVGASEMTAHLLKLKEDAEVKQIGERLEEAVAWFYEKPA